MGSCYSKAKLIIFSISQKIKESTTTIFLGDATLISKKRRNSDENFEAELLLNEGDEHSPDVLSADDIQRIIGYSKSYELDNKYHIQAMGDFGDFQQSFPSKNISNKKRKKNQQDDQLPFDQSKPEEIQISLEQISEEINQLKIIQ